MNSAAVSAASSDSSVQDVPVPKWGKSLGGFTRKVLTQLGRDKWDISVLLCDDNTIAALNRKYRGKAEATDILSFALDEGEEFPACNGGRNCGLNQRRTVRRMPGDIVISLDTLRENARSFGISEDEELRRLLIHGILHLDGRDHRSNGETEPMLQLQERILADLEGERIMPKVRGKP
jgi:probable rRNA maturation factor